MLPYINTGKTMRDDLDTLTSVAVVEIPASSLKAGMVLVDPDLDTPVGEVAHRLRATRNAGSMEFQMFDFDDRRWITQSIHANATIKVMAR